MYAQRLTDDVEFRDDSYSGTSAYARTKRMQVVLAHMWSHRLAVWLLAPAQTTPWSGGFWHDRAPRPVHYSRRTAETGADRDRFMARCDEAVASYVEPD